ncbi:MAG TPA: hypothetical protein VJ795_12560, partial [Rheinheimera sp.]|uniref:hypothetical protein n=1 Tax=Rheinheimera sp. TaxID=1869214 RepID=UPI002B47E5C0
MILNLKSLVILISLFAIYSCASFKPIVMANYDKKNYTGTDPTKCSGKFPQQDICSARKFTFDTTKKYKDEILKAYGETNNYDNGILGAVTLGIAARLASAHTDVFNALAVGLGYQTAVKTYNNESFKLQLYSNVIRATQCVYNNSSRLEAEASTADTIKIARDKFTAFQTLTSSQPAEVKKIYDEKFKSQQGEFSTFTQRI